MPAVQAPVVLDALGVTAHALGQIADPIMRAKAIRAVADEVDASSERLRRMLAAALNEARSAEPRPSWREIGEALGITGQRAEQLARTTQEDTTP